MARAVPALFIDSPGAELNALGGDKEHLEVSVRGGPMMMVGIVSNPLVLRAAVLGAFGGIDLVLTSVYSRRGPLIFPVYAALLAATGLLLAKYSSLPFGTRLGAGLTVFMAASVMLYIAVCILARNDRERLIEQGRLPATARAVHLTLWGHLWRLGSLAMIGCTLCAGIAYIVG